MSNESTQPPESARPPFPASIAGNAIGWQWPAAAAVLVAGCSLLVAIELLVEGPFLWHFTRHSALQGFIEVLVLWGVLAVVLARCRNARWRMLWVALPVAFYLRRHHADLPLLVALLYAEFLLALGLLAGRASGVWRNLEIGRRDAPWVDQLLLGIVFWSLALWLLQVLELGQDRTARILLATAAVPVLLVAHRTPLTVDLVRKAFSTDRWTRLASAGAMAFLCALFARTNQFAGHDALWYGFRPDQVLVGESSVYEQLGLVSPVYYFPKLYEVLLLPLSAMGDFSFVGGFTILLSGLVALLVSKLLLRHSVPATFSAIVSVAVLTMPALANTALSPKPDVLAALAVLAMAWHLNGMLARRAEARHFGFLLGWAAIAALSKLNLLPYVAVIGLASLIVLASRCRTGVDWSSLRALLPMLLAATLVGIAVTGRTWVLAGMPTVAPEQLVSLWKWAGLELEAPVGTLQWVEPQHWPDVPVLMLDWLLRPARLPHVIISWCGNAWFALALVPAIAAGMRRGTNRAAPPSSPWSEWLVAGTGLLLLLGVRYHYRGSDGNYFIAPVAAAWILAAVAASRRTPWVVRDRLVALALGSAIVFQAWYAFVSAGWGSPGTRPLDLNLTRSAWDTEGTRAAELKSAGLANIGRYLRDHTSGGWRIVGSTPEPDGFWLRARYESLETIAFSRPEFVESPRGFLRLLACGRMDAIIVSRKHDDPTRRLLREAGLEGASGTALASDSQYLLLDVRKYAAAMQCTWP